MYFLLFFHSFQLWNYSFLIIRLVTYILASNFLWTKIVWLICFIFSLARNWCYIHQMEVWWSRTHLSPFVVFFLSVFIVTEYAQLEIIYWNFYLIFSLIIIQLLSYITNMRDISYHIKRIIPSFPDSYQTVFSGALVRELALQRWVSSAMVVWA